MRPIELPQLPGLNQLRVVLGVCGGIAAYKSAELVRLLVKQGCTVQVVMTESATHFIAPLTFQALSGKAVHVSQWPAENGNQGNLDRGMPHIDISRHADFLLIAPCTANSMAKYAHGFADNLLDNLVLARNCPMAIAPAMNVEMWNNRATQRNISQLQTDGIHVFGPAAGEQACGEVGSGRMLEPFEVVLELARAVNPKPLAGKKILLTAGPTFEAIDPVRGITNRSSGKMGYALAQAAWLMGGEVTLVSGPTALPSPYGAHILQVQSAKQMHAAVFGQIEQNDLFIGVAAVADYGIKNPSVQKQKKQSDRAVGLHMEFELNPDILAEVGELASKRTRPLTVVGFAAETENLDEYASRKLESKKAQFIIGNLAQHALGADQTRLSIYSKRQPPERLDSMDKLSAAEAVLSFISKHTQTHTS
ncbi:MAG: bifunctional phosphopantothenoylcysteine decarboxylase/phosphopantothenate--cysteine ligase CoaBC [Burkholderiales bacterium]|jgi:phosphopantothenoylcysteine decarboxylase/phosphopantothenate--cysteine ligase|uniref:bifunctional phosphopantothenoylcysteine decarboxylase/phosphopantothenate--cysteine ligase CoaBC n=1 Tax=Limnobacter sp. TaxID=2003368 RepID=UPI0039BD555C|nr:bifunctional phosphopantothenoylcysteine decarboxylase/phosphopantothenate--cysteine ligase CoaBC [Burkholderiales bacterium]